MGTMLQKGGGMRMENIVISVVLTLFDPTRNLEETISTIRKQTFENFEVLCLVPSEENTLAEYLRSVSEQDARFRTISLDDRDLGKARNCGIRASTGQYVVFFDAGESVSCDMMEKLYRAAEARNADFVVCDFVRRQVRGREAVQAGINKSWLPADMPQFSYQDSTDYIMRIADPYPGNKLYKRAFLFRNQLAFEESSSVPEFSFVPVCSAAAERITYVPEVLLQTPVGASTRPRVVLKDVERAMIRAVEKVRSLPYVQLLNNAVLSFVADSLILSMARYVRDFSGEDAADFYKMANETFNRKEFENVSEKTFHNINRYLEFSTVKKHDYETMKTLVSRRLVVSLTSYPRRIGSIAEVLETIYAQTRKADEVILWLAEEQFPGKEKELPQELLKLVSQKRLTVRWCDDLKPHKKYFYALQEYDHDLVVTVDDDLLYPKDMLATLYKSYLQYPNAVSTVRAHLAILSEQREIMPYSAWIQETDACLYQPSMQMVATGGAGVLHPPGLFRKEFFDKKAIVENCLWADDLWLKAMQLVSDVPVVLARPFEQLNYLPDSQEEALYQINVKQNQNDVQLERIIRWTDAKFGEGILVKKLTESGQGTDILGVEAVSSHLDKERKNERWKRLTTERKLQNAECERNQTKAQLEENSKKLRTTEETLAQTEKELRQTKDLLACTEKQLKQTQEKLRQVEESKPIKRQLQDLGKFLQNQKAKGHSPITWWIKYLVYILAWIPEAILTGMMFLLENGLKLTVKQIYRKIFKRR